MLELYISLGLGAAIVALCFISHKLGETENATKHQEEELETLAVVHKIRAALCDSTVAKRVRERWRRK